MLVNEWAWGHESKAGSELGFIFEVRAWTEMERYGELQACIGYS